MNKLVEFTSKKNRKRVGRGISAGQGKTAGRGTKGQNSRSGVSLRPSFEGGQTPFVQKLPKLKGFKSHRAETTEVKVSDLKKVSGKTVNNETLAKTGLIKDVRAKVKIISDSKKLDTAKNVEVSGASKNAEQQIIDAGGSFKKAVVENKQQTKN